MKLSEVRNNNLNDAIAFYEEHKPISSETWRVLFNSQSDPDIQERFYELSRGWEITKQTRR